MTDLTTITRRLPLLTALFLLGACNDATGPVITTYGVELTGATAQHGAAVLTLQNLPANLTFTAAPGVIVHARPSRNGQGYTVLVAGDLTRKPLLTVAMPKASPQTGTVSELADTNGELVTAGLPAVVFVAR